MKYNLMNMEIERETLEGDDYTLVFDELVQIFANSSTRWPQILQFSLKFQFFSCFLG
ncbi:hypothetical protein Scep_027790 [Stephania cephalantha]|uniref:Uncharacterized protein n=1 Tax=Stephania cephalantha TaxID=152367 RepID=A0AAP0HHJ6_9MAGN